MPKAMVNRELREIHERFGQGFEDEEEDEDDGGGGHTHFLDIGSAKGKRAGKCRFIGILEVFWP